MQNSGRKLEPIRWTIERAGAEFATNPRTISSRLKGAGVEPGADGKFSTLQICSAVFSDYEQERTRLTKAQADQAELDLARARNEVLPVDVAFQACSNVAFAALRIFEQVPDEKLSPEEKDAIRREIMDFKPSLLVAEKKFEEGEKE